MRCVIKNRQWHSVCRIANIESDRVILLIGNVAVGIGIGCGDVSFQAAQSGWNVRNITFTGSIIADAAGNVAGLEGTWKGTWIPVVVGRAAETAKARALPGVGLFPSATGTWAAVAHPVME
jgi:hypothetical protein